MKTGIKLLNSSGLLGGAEVVNNGCLFLRNLILARLLTKADFGIAATLGLVVALFELAGKMSFAQQCTQSPRGEDPHFQNVCHASQALAGLFSAALILAFVYPISTLFGMPEHRQAIALLAIVPLCTGFSNLDVYRLLRHLNFLPLVLTDAVPQVLLTMAAWPLASWLNDYRAILCILLGKAVLSLAASHLLAQRPYRLSWDAVLARENFRFGWPLLVTSFVMVGIFQGDRFLIASRYSFADLGSYAAAATMAMAPGMMLFKITGPIALPLLAKVQEFPKKFMLHYGVFTQGMALCASVFAVAMVLGSEPAVTLLFGQKYRTAATLVTWLALAQAVRILRGAPTCAAMAKGDTVNTLMSNVWRLSGLVLAVPFAISKMDLRWIAIAGGVGEVIAYWYAIRDLQAKCEVPLLSSLLPAGGLMISTLAAFAVKWAFCPSQTLWIVAFSILGCVGSVLLFALVFSDLRKAVCSLAVDVASEAKLLVQRKFLRSVPTGS